ncbi:MAG: ABC transporter permease [Xanthomonadaceae bacterium]|nr:ABC transporter permease [Xanthomonadaceae bacterium]
MVEFQMMLSQSEFLCLNHRFLVSNLVNRNLKVKYRRSIAGILWTLLAPLSLAGLYFLVFRMILKVDQPFYMAFILSGVLPWNFISQSLVEGVDSLVGNWALISKVPVPVQVFPYVGTVTNFISLLIAIPVAIAASIISGAPVGVSLIALIPLLVCLFIIVYSIAMILGITYVILRDLKNAVGILIQFWFYATPVIYSEAMIPESFKWMIYVNPFGTFFASIHSILVRGEWPQAPHAIAILAWSAGLMLLASFLYGRYRRQVVEQI